MKAIICGALMALTITKVHAAEKDVSSANFMLPFCKLTSAQVMERGPHDAYFHGECFGVVEGIRKVLSLIRVSEQFGDGKLSVVLCTAIPPQVTNGQLVNVVLRRAEIHPELTHEEFETFLLMHYMKHGRKRSKHSRFWLVTACNDPRAVPVMNQIVRIEPHSGFIRSPAYDQVGSAG